MGRPTKEPKGKQVQLTVLVRGDVKRALVAAAKKSGRTLSTETVFWFEELETYRMIFKRMQQTAEDMARGSYAAAGEREGFIHIRAADTTGKIFNGWLEPGYPGSPKEGTGFFPRREGEQPTGRVEIREDEIEAIPGDESDEKESEK